MHGITGGDACQINLDEFGQIPGQTGDFDLVHDVRNDGAAELDRLRILRIDEVERHLDMDFAIRIDTLKVHVLNLLPECMHLVVAQQNLLGHTIDLQIQDGGMEGLLAHGME